MLMSWCVVVALLWSVTATGQAAPDVPAACAAAGLVCYSLDEDRATAHMIADLEADAARCEEPDDPIGEPAPGPDWSLLLGVGGGGVAVGVVLTVLARLL